MSFLTRNLFEFKFVRLLVTVSMVGLALFLLLDYNSPAKKCERKANDAVSKLPINPTNKLQQKTLEETKKQLIEACINNK